MATKKKMLQAAAGNAGGAGGEPGLNVEDVFSTYLYTGNGSTQTITNGIQLEERFDSTYTSSGTYYWECPVGVTSVSVVCVGGGGAGGAAYWSGGGGGGGGLGYKNNISVTPGQSYTVVVGAGGVGVSDASGGDGGDSYFIGTSTVAGFGGGGGFSPGNDTNSNHAGGTGGTYVGDGGDNGGTGGTSSADTAGGGGGAAGYSGKGGNGGTNANGQNGSGGGGGGGAAGGGNGAAGAAPSGGGVGLFGEGSSGIGGASGGTGGSGGGNGSGQATVGGASNTGGNFGGGGGGQSNDSRNTPGCNGGSGGVRIVWNAGSSFPTTNVDESDASGDTNVGGLVWIKSRTEGTYGGHALFDTERGPNKVLTSSGDSGVAATMAEVTSSSTSQDLTSFNSNGFSLGPDYYFNKNTSGEDYASWTFRKAPKFFTCVTWTGDGTSNRAIPHDLGGAVGSYFVKCTSASTASDWLVWHKDLPLNSDNLVLNTTAAQDNYNLFSTTAPDSSNVYLGTANLDYFNATGRTYVAYIFAHNDGDGGFGADGDLDIVKCGSYTGTSAAGNFIDLGFEPQWVLYKRTDSTGNWVLQDNMRGMDHTSYDLLYANTSGAEVSGTAAAGAKADPRGFTIDLNGGDHNSSGGTYIYIAIRRGTKVPESATEVFGMDDYGTGGDGPVTGFVTDFSLLRYRNQNDNWHAVTRLCGESYLKVQETTAETNNGNAVSDRMDGMWNTAVPNYFLWGWKRAPGYFDSVAYTSTATSGNPQTESHNLGVVPEMMWVKCRSTAKDWQVYHADLGVSKRLILNSNSAELSAGVGAWNTAPTATSFTVGDDSEFGGGGRTYIAYLFASLDGISKVGSFTYSGSTLNVDCGFSSGARFVLLKRTDGAQNWTMFDTARGIVAGADPVLILNNTNAEGSYDWIDPYSSGFTLAAGAWNNGPYIFYAIA